MMEENKVSLEELLSNAIADKIDQMNQCEPGSKEATAIAKDIAVLYNELTKSMEAGFKIEEVNARFEFESHKFDEEMKLKREQLEFEKQKHEEEKEAEAKKEKADKVDTILKCVAIGVDILAIVSPLCFYGNWMNKGLEFEKTGSFTSSTFRTWLGKLKPSKTN